MYKILLVEDDKALASAMKAQLESWGNEVAVAEDLRDVMTSFRDTAPQLSCWISYCPSSTAITGAVRSVLSPMSR